MTDIETDLPFSTELIHLLYDDIDDQTDAAKIVNNELTISDMLPGLVRGEATALLLDINNLFKRSRSNNFRIDYARLRSIFANRCDLRYCEAFSAVDPEDPNSSNWVSFMTSQGYTLNTKNIYRYETKGTSTEEVRTITKGNMDVEIVISAMTLNSAFAHVIVAACDGDFSPLIRELKKDKFRKVSVLGLRDEDGTGMSDRLIKEADNFYDMNKLKDFISYKKSS
jgi:uncharacterized LabA/DUF88 family protein